MSWVDLFEHHPWMFAIGIIPALIGAIAFCSMLETFAKAIGGHYSPGHESGVDDSRD